jgi:acetoin utilization deacetylase AcuC-like enzyme
MQWFYHPGYVYGRGIPLLPTTLHGFVLDRAAQIHARLIDAGVVTARAFQSPRPVVQRLLAQVHTPAVLAGLHDGWALATAMELWPLALLPHHWRWRAVVEPQLLAAGGTCAALRAAATGEWAINLSGGFHHARPDFSHGFCLVNDLSLGVAHLRQRGLHKHLVVLDCDLHQGDGNAVFFADDPEVYTVSLHQGNIFPMPKMRSDLDIALRPGADDKKYLAALETALKHIRRQCAPDLIVYIAGSDPYKGDRLSSLAVTQAGLLHRDRRGAE